eukprot:scaffold6067_cov112-Isochrysis_galbana.AAC.28
MNARRPTFDWKWARRKRPLLPPALLCHCASLQRIQRCRPVKGCGGGQITKSPSCWPTLNAVDGQLPPMKTAGREHHGISTGHPHTPSSRSSAPIMVRSCLSTERCC